MSTKTCRILSALVIAFVIIFGVYRTNKARVKANNLRLKEAVGLETVAGCKYAGYALALSTEYAERKASEVKTSLSSRPSYIRDEHAALVAWSKEMEDREREKQVVKRSFFAEQYELIKIAEDNFRRECPSGGKL